MTASRLLDVIRRLPPPPNLSVMGMTGLQQLGIGPGDEVVVPAFGAGEAFGAVRVSGATPVFADIDPRTYCLSPPAVEAAVTRSTVAVVAVDLFGHPVDRPALQAVAERRGIGLVAPRPAPDVPVDARRRMQNAAYLSAHLTGVLPPVDASEDRGHTYTSYVVRVPGNGRPDRDAFRLALRHRGIETAVPVRVPAARLPEAARAADETLALPVDACLTRRELHRMVSVCNSLGGLLYEAV